MIVIVLLIWHVIIGVCRQSFVQCYSCSHSLLDDICASLKEGKVTQAPELHDKTVAYVYDTAFKNARNEIASKSDRFLNCNQIAAAQIPNTIQSLSCYAWMASYFDLTGDKIPNRECEIHLEPIEKNEIYAEVFHVT